MFTDYIRPLVADTNIGVKLSTLCVVLLYQ